MPLICRTFMERTAGPMLAYFFGGNYGPYGVLDLMWMTSRSRFRS
jgi:hypothetical protein